MKIAKALIPLALTVAEAFAQGLGPQPGRYPELKPFQDAVAGWRAAVDAAKVACTDVKMVTAAACGAAAGKLEVLGNVLEAQAKAIPKSVKNRGELRKEAKRVRDAGKALRDEPTRSAEALSEKFAAQAKQSFGKVDVEQAKAAYLAVFNLGAKRGKELSLLYNPLGPGFVIPGSEAIPVEELAAVLQGIDSRGWKAFQSDSILGLTR